MSSPPIKRLATTIFVAVFLVGALVILTTGLGVEYLGPLIVFDASLICVYLLLYAPTERSSD